MKKILLGLVLGLVLISCDDLGNIDTSDCGTITNCYYYWDPYYGDCSVVYLNNGYYYTVPYNPSYYVGQYVCL